MEIKLPERPEQHPTPQDDGRAEAVNRHLAGLRHSAARIQGSIEDIKSNQDVYMGLSDKLRDLTEAIVDEEFHEDSDRLLEPNEIEDLDGLRRGLEEFEETIARRAKRDAQPINVFGLTIFGVSNPWAALRQRGHDKLEVSHWDAVIDYHVNTFKATMQRVWRRIVITADIKRTDLIKKATPVIQTPRLELPAPVDEGDNEWDEESIRMLEQALDDLQSPLPFMPTGRDEQGWIDWLDQIIHRPGLDLKLYKRAIHRLRSLCRQANKLPSSCKLPEEDISFEDKPIATSVFSDIYRGVVNNNWVALKSLRITIEDQGKVLKGFYHEASVWRSLRHPNIVEFLGVSSAFKICLVSRWMRNGTILDFLRDYPSTNRVMLTRQIVDGLTYMHSLDLVHGDLKTSNILIDDSGTNACLTDFGQVTVLHQTGSFSHTASMRGTYRWMAPELLSIGDTEEFGSYPSFSSDVYALAIVIWQLFSGDVPYNELRNDMQIAIQVVKGLRPSRPTDAEMFGLSDEVWDVMTRAWSADAGERPSLSAIAQVLDSALLTM